jgi:hypothetical protein
MTPTRQDHSARRRFSTDNFDCELPPAARTELTQPRRPRILARAKDPLPIGRLIMLGFAVLVMIAGIGALWHKGEAERVKTDQAILPALSTPIATPSHSQTVQPRLATQPPAPRAELISTPHWVNMPDGRNILVHYKGEVPDVWALPPQHGINNAMYHVLEDGNYWIWTVPLNSNIPMWIDP